MRADLRVVWDYLAVARRAQRSSVLFCFGSAHYGVARRAAAFYQDGIAPWVLVTGGTVGSASTHATEAEVYTDILRAAGVPQERIVAEHEAMNTGENVIFGMRALADRGIDIDAAVLLALPTTLRRCVATFAHHYPAVQTFTEPSFNGLGPHASDPEDAVRVALVELERVRSYPDLGFMARQDEPPEVTTAAQRLVESRATLAPLSI